MNSASNGIASARPGLQPTTRRQGWLGSLSLGAFLVLVYLINGRVLGSDDAFSATLLAVNIARGDGVYLETEHPGVVQRDEQLPYYWVKSHGHVVTMYPIAPALVAVPLVAPQVAMLKFFRPDWDRNRKLAVEESGWMVKRSMAVIVALAGVILHRYLLALGLRRTALPAVLAACLGSDLWTVGSQAAWQHGPAALALIAAIALLHPQPASRFRLALAGFATAVMVACRLMDIVFASAIVAWLLWTDWRGLFWYLPAPILCGLALLASNLWFFDSIVGGQAQLEHLHKKFHGVSGPWSGNLIEGMLGTLFSPNRGLVAFSPWIAVAVATLTVPTLRQRLAAHSLIMVLLAALVPYLLILSKYSVWWGGHCFGPRYWTDSVPLFAILFAFGLDEVLTRSRALVTIAAMTVVFSIAVQSIGAFCYPSSWNTRPRNVDRHHERLWDWRDTELSRSLTERFARGAR
jgi:hypothetical protein